MSEVSSAAAAGARSEQLIGHLAGLTLHGLDAAVVRAARMRLLDILACGFYGARMPWAQIAAAVAYAERSAGGATVVGHAAPIAPARAALCNGTAMHGIELDDIAEGAQVHPGAIVIAAALAAAEHCEASGERLLLAIVAGYEALARTGRAIGKAPMSFHVTGVAGPVGAAVAAAVLMGLQPEQIMRAVGIACSCSAGIKAFTQGSGGMVKRMHAGRAAESGVLACLLAQRGFTAPLAAIDGRFGLLDAFGGDNRNAGRLTDQLGHDYVVREIWTKVYACCGSLHSTAQVLGALRDEHRLQPAMIEKIRVGVHPYTVALNSEAAPRETMAAQYSLPFVAAVALTGDPMNPRSFEGGALQDPVLFDLARRVELHADGEMEALYPSYAARVAVHLRGGGKLERTLRDAHGTPGDPCTESEVREKFRRLAAASLRPEAMESVLDIIARIEQLPSIAPLSAALRGST